MLRRSVPVQIHVDLGNVGLVLRDPPVEHLDVSGVLLDRFGIAKIRKIDRVAFRVGELALERIDFALVGLRIVVGAGERVHQRLAVVAVRLHQLADQGVDWIGRIGNQRIVRGLGLHCGIQRLLGVRSDLPHPGRRARPRPGHVGVRLVREVLAAVHTLLVERTRRLEFCHHVGGRRFTGPGLGAQVCLGGGPLVVCSVKVGVLSGDRERGRKVTTISNPLRRGTSGSGAVPVGSRPMIVCGGESAVELVLEMRLLQPGALQSLSQERLELFVIRFRQGFFQQRDDLVQVVDVRSYSADSDEAARHGWNHVLRIVAVGIVHHWDNQCARVSEVVAGIDAIGTNPGPKGGGADRVLAVDINDQASGVCRLRGPRPSRRACW